MQVRGRRAYLLAGVLPVRRSHGRLELRARVLRVGGDAGGRRGGAGGVQRVTGGRSQHLTHRMLLGRVRGMTMRQWGAWTVVMVLLLAVGNALFDVGGWTWQGAWFGAINGLAARALVKDNVAPLSRKERRRRQHDVECAAALAPHEQRLRDRGIL